ITYILAVQLRRVYLVAQQVNKCVLANRIVGSKGDDGAHSKFGVVGNIKVKLVVLHVQCGGPKLSLIAGDGVCVGHAGVLSKTVTIVSPNSHRVKAGLSWYRQS